MNGLSTAMGRLQQAVDQVKEESSQVKSKVTSCLGKITEMSIAVTDLTSDDDDDDREDCLAVTNPNTCGAVLQVGRDPVTMHTPSNVQ